ncbi:MAG: cytidine deaminase [Candidatus Saccharibacteria bacterium]|nr:cytidine deaminase [Patescibacteria group bacterium]MCA9335560.1 cytidine deaminase [Candidatus Saccharibacteria bacterium]MCA9336311.1 cytidine deaminase [Candidatus Saccharibacteria bacterium]MCA9340156.1 cytidine deaminase [Candidatus Saccharibacteria bacterium]HPQ82415.1 hypothetical protein [Candidatus Saccharimonas sp.]
MNPLVQKAKELLEARFMPPYHTVAAVIVTSDGSEYSGINIDHFSGYLCAEASALAAAINDGKMAFDSVVAVGQNENNEFDVINPCGKCRQLLHDFAPGIKVLVKENDVESTLGINELLPHSFKRRQEKIRRARRGEDVI